MINVRDLGAIGDGIADDTAALQTALNQSGTVRIERGTYKITDTLVPRCDAIIGDGRFSSVIRPSAGVTKAMAINSSGCYPSYLSRFRFDGSLTTNATALFLGDAGSCSVSAESMTIDDFGVGLRIGDALKTRISSLYTNRCGRGALFQKVSSGFPTTITLQSCIFNASAINGAHVIDGNSITFSGIDFESSGQEGCLVQPGSCGTVQDVLFDGRCWFENNWASDPSKFALLVDGSASSCTARVQVRSAFFSGNSGTCKSIRITGAGAAGFVLDNPSVPNLPSQIQIDAGAYGRVCDASGHVNLNATISDTAFSASTPNLGSGSSTYRGFTDWSPVFSSSAGNAATTFSGGAPIVQQARFKIIGRILLIQLRFSAVLNAVTPAYLQFTLPGSLSSHDNNNYSPCVVKDSTPVLGLTRTDGGNAIQISRADFANLGSGASVGAFINIAIELSS